MVFGCLVINTLQMVRLSIRGVRPWTRGGGVLVQDMQAVDGDERRLAVVVPAHGGDLRRALASLSRWPTLCSPVTVQHVDLVLYFAGTEEDDDWADDVLPELEKTGGRCFAKTNVVFGNLTDEVRARRGGRKYTIQNTVR